MNHIKTKQQMYTLLQNGNLGNTIQTWNYSEFEPNLCSNKVHIRYANKKLHGPCHTGINPQDVNQLLDMYEQQGWNKSTAIIGLDLPNDKRVLQGQFQITENHYDLTYTTIPLPMRQAFDIEQKYASGLIAITIMRTFIDAASLDDIVELSIKYDGAVVEFTTCSTNIGNLPHRNTIIWEVRNY